LEYEQKTADIQKALEREKVDYAKQQDEIRKKSNDTLRGIVEDYQKAFKDIFDAIRDSGVPSLLAQLPGLTQGAMDASIQGVQIPENYSAKEEFVKNWQGLYGRLPTDDEINIGAVDPKTKMLVLDPSQYSIYKRKGEVRIKWEELSHYSEPLLSTDPEGVRKIMKQIKWRDRKFQWRKLLKCIRQKLITRCRY